MPVTIPGLPTALPAARINGGPSTAEFFDFFFADNGGLPANAFDLFFQWDVSGGSVDLVGGVGPGVFGAAPSDPNGRLVDLGGSTRNPGRFETRLEYPTVAGQTYNLTFDYRSIDGRTASATVTVGDRTFTVSTADTAFSRFSQDFTATGTDLVRIVFQGDERDRDNSGLGIDGVLFGTVLSTGPDEVLVASPNPNFLEGEDGNDTLVGNIFDDLLIGGAGNDTLTGGAGADLFLFGSDLARGRDRILDFTTEDRIITTVALRDGNRDGEIQSRDGRFDFTQGGSVAINGDTGGTIRSLRLDGEFTEDGVRYFVYSRTGGNDVSAVSDRFDDFNFG